MQDPVATTERPWHAETAEAALARRQSSPQGLASAEAAKRLELNGPNRLPAGKRRSLLARVFAQFNNLLIYVLLASALVTVLLRHALDAVVILAVVLINAAIGFIQEGRAEKSLEAIRAMLTPRGLGPARRPAAHRSGRKPGGRRRRADRSGRPHSRRPKALARLEPQDRGSGADRRVGPGGQVGRPRRSGRGARRPRLDGLFRHAGRERPRRGTGGRNRRLDRAWAHQRHGRGRRIADHAALAPDGYVRQAPDDRHSGRRRRRRRLRGGGARLRNRAGVHGRGRRRRSPPFPKACPR